MVQRSGVLIETYWNVKNNSRICIVSLMPVLIETYWNVKTFTGAMINSADMVLIETYWNVKKGGIGKTTTSDSSINRNILECKEIYTDC